MKNLKKYLIGFIIGISCVNAYTFATETYNGTIGDLFEYVTDSWKLKANTVGTTQLSNLAVTLSKLATNSVDSSKIIDLSIRTSDLADSSVTLSKLATNSVDSSKILDGSVNTSDLANNSVTEFKLGSNSVTSSRIKDGSINTSDLANNSVTSSKISNNSIDSFKIINGSILGTDLANGSITSDKIAGNSVDSSKIVNDAISTDKILNGSITQDDLEPSIVEKLNREVPQLVMCQNNFGVRGIKGTYQKNDSKVSNDYLIRYQSSGTVKILVNESCGVGNVSDAAFRKCMGWDTVGCGNASVVPKTITHNGLTWIVDSSGMDLEWCGKGGSDGSWGKYYPVKSTDYLYDKECDTL